MIKINTYKEIPTQGTYIVLTQSKSFLGRAIQGFMRLFQFTRGIHNTSLVPNHADALNDGIGIGALGLGVKVHAIKKHFGRSKEATFYVIFPSWTEEERLRFWEFMCSQEGEKYAYLDLLKYILRSLNLRWPGNSEPLNRSKWTCYSLVASAYNYAKQEEFFKDPYKISPWEFFKMIPLIEN